MGWACLHLGLSIIDITCQALPKVHVETSLKTYNTVSDQGKIAHVAAASAFGARPVKLTRLYLELSPAIGSNLKKFTEKEEERSTV